VTAETVVRVAIDSTRALTPGCRAMLAVTASRGIMARTAASERDAVKGVGAEGSCLLHSDALAGC
jgi:hypothetical protein